MAQIIGGEFINEEGKFRLWVHRFFDNWFFDYCWWNLCCPPKPKFDIR